MKRAVSLCLFALLTWAAPVVSPPLRADGSIQYAPPDVSKPVTVTADKVRSWTEDGTQILFLEGNTLIEQGTLRARMEQAVLWLETAAADEERTLPITVYGEGSVEIIRSGTAETQPMVVMQLRTSNVFKLSSDNRESEDLSQEPLYQRAVAERNKLSELNIESDAVTPAVALTNDETKDAEPVQRVQLIERDSPDETAVETTVRSPEQPGSPVQLRRPVPEQLAPPTTSGPAPGVFGNFRPRRIRINAESAEGIAGGSVQTAPGEQAYVLLGRVSVVVEEPQFGIIDISADRAVVWERKPPGQQNSIGLPNGEATDSQYEVYLEGHVEIRQQSLAGPTAGQVRLLMGDRVYYDVSRTVALVDNGELITTQPGLPVPIHMRAREIRQVAENKFEATDAELFASRLPSDPGLKVVTREATIERRQVPRTGLFGRQFIDPATGAPATQDQLWSTADDIVLELEDFPVLYFPYARGDLRDPLGPLERVRFRQDSIFGTGILLDWDMFELLGGEAPPDTKWTLQTDILTDRGPALGSEFSTAGVDLFGLPGRYTTLVRGWGIYDDGRDILGGPREFAVPKNFRGRLLARHRQEIGEDFTFLGQFSYLSDRNFLEQFFKREFDDEINQETLAYLKQQRDNWAWSIEAQPNIRSWVTETEWLPRADGYLVGESFFDRFTYFARGSAGYASLSPSSDITAGYVATPFPAEFARTRLLPPSSDLPHHTSIGLGRVDIWQELNMPVPIGPVKAVPYGIFDITHYTDTLAGDDATRLYGGGGLRASIPFTRVYPDICSTLFNVNGIAHKIVFDADYRYVVSDTNFRILPLLDRLDDDATDQARRDLRLFRLATFPPMSDDAILATSPLFDPQLYAIRRGYERSAETLDDLQVLRLGARQRWQTKRGFPGRQNIIDWMTLDLEVSIFPDSGRDNFGEDWAFLEYDYAWHIGDRTSLLSSGWLDPHTDGPSVFSIGMILDRPERISHYVGYRNIEPIGADIVTVATSYIFSPKWAATVSTGYDFGVSQNLGNSLVLTRIGTDILFSLGFSYEALRNNFGVTFEIVPSLVPRSGLSPLAMGGSGVLGR